MREKQAILLDAVSFHYVDISEYSEDTPCHSPQSTKETCAEKSCISDVSFEVAPGTCSILCGRSGDGKSTILRLINGLAGTFFPGRLCGVVAVMGRPVAELTPRLRTEEIGVVMQDPRSQFFMGRVGDEIAFSLENMGMDPHEVIEHIHRTASACGVENLLDCSLSELSSGQKQRVALAGAYACNPAVLVLDEPTSNLDAQGSQDLIATLNVFKQAGVAIVVSEHRLHQFLPVADTYLCLRKGHLVARWSATEFAALTVNDTSIFGLRHPDMVALSKGDLACKGSLPASSLGAQSSIFSHVDETKAWLLKDITATYPSTKRGLKNITATFPLGAVSVIKGANGVGKTTLAKVLCGALRIQKGSVSYKGQVLSRRERRARSYFVMQDADYQLYAASVADEVVFGRRVDRELEALAQKALAAFGLSSLKDCHPASLSGGQKQRVMLAAAYCSDAELIVLDEPTSGLDGEGVREVSSWCRTLATACKTVVIITHDELLATLAGDVVIEL